MDQRHSPKVDTAGVRPVITMGGIMPGGSEMRHWHQWVPFPNPDEIAREAAAGQAHTPLERAREAELARTGRRRMELGTCVRPAGSCMYEYACTRCPFLQLDADALPRLLEIEEDTRAALDKARANGWDGEVVALTDTLARIAEKKATVPPLPA